MPQIDPDSLRRAMDRSGVSISHLARETGLSLSYTSDICSGRRTLARSPQVRKRIAAALDVPQHWIEVKA